MTNLEKALEIMKNEFDMEMAAAKASDEMMKKTLNPIKRWQLSKSKKTFIDHAVGIKLAMDKIKREIK